MLVHVVMAVGVGRGACVGGACGRGRGCACSWDGGVVHDGGRGRARTGLVKDSASWVGHVDCVLVDQSAVGKVFAGRVHGNVDGWCLFGDSAALC
ncbi:hypothetical protein BCR44DRAFT_1446442, partial [Catenaria anguillulae PL171]